MAKPELCRIDVTRDDPNVQTTTMGHLPPLPLETEGAIVDVPSAHAILAIETTSAVGCGSSPVCRTFFDLTSDQFNRFGPYGLPATLVWRGRLDDEQRHGNTRIRHSRYAHPTPLFALIEAVTHSPSAAARDLAAPWTRWLRAELS